MDGLARWEGSLRKKETGSGHRERVDAALPRVAHRGADLKLSGSGQVGCWGDLAVQGEANWLRGKSSLICVSEILAA